MQTGFSTQHQTCESKRCACRWWDSSSPSSSRHCWPSWQWPSPCRAGSWPTGVARRSPARCRIRPTSRTRSSPRRNHSPSRRPTTSRDNLDYFLLAEDCDPNSFFVFFFFWSCIFVVLRRVLSVKPRKQEDTCNEEKREMQNVIYCDRPVCVASPNATSRTRETLLGSVRLACVGRYRMNAKLLIPVSSALLTFYLFIFSRIHYFVTLEDVTTKKKEKLQASPGTITRDPDNPWVL